MYFIHISYLLYQCTVILSIIMCCDILHILGKEEKLLRQLQEKIFQTNKKNIAVVC